jgi:hypothetical protein
VIRERLPRRFRSAAAASSTGLVLLLAAVPVAAQDPSRGGDSGAATSAAEPCQPGETLATGAPDTSIFAREASRGVRAFWCETYDRDGHAIRAGVYWDVHADGTIRTRARYVASRIEGPVEVLDEEGALWLQGVIDDGEWEGPFELFHPNGERWLSASFRDGRLDGPVETRFPDGSIESRTFFVDGVEDELAALHYPAQAGGGLRSQVRVEADRIVETVPARPADASLSQAALPGPVGAAGRPAALDPDTQPN